MKRAIGCLSLLLTMACAGHKEPDLASFSGRSDRIIWESGQKALAKKDWVGAREHFRRIVDGFPNSDLAPQARLGLGDAYLREGGTANYILAISEYRQFLTLYPSHPQSDYAQLQVGEAFFKQKNGPDRDQSQTRDALAEFQKVVEQHPQSQYAAKAQERIAQCRYSLARAEHTIGFFYQRTRQALRAAVARYETLVTEYPEYPQLDEVLLHLSECLIASGRQAEAAPYLKRLLDNYPESPVLPQARKLLTQVPPPAVPTPAASAQETPPAAPALK
jgi:outer membrane protein assembly factor BamD